MGKHGVRSRSRPKNKKKLAKTKLNSMAIDAVMEEEGITEKIQTRGHLLQKHKVEWKDIRKEIAEKKEQRLKLSKHDASQKAAKKALSKEIQLLTTNMKTRHAKELELFDKANEGLQIDLDTTSFLGAETDTEMAL